MNGLVLAVFLLAGAMRAGETVEILRDPAFHDGFRIIDPDTKEVYGVIKSTEGGLEPAWKIAQWGTRFNFKDTPNRRELESGAIVLEDETKYIEFRHEDGMLVLGLDSITEYQGQFRDKSRGWPHLLVQQNFKSPFLDRFESLILSLEAKILEAEDIENPEQGYNPSLHASQFNIFFVVKDDQAASRGRHDFYWHGVPLYDSRKRFHKESLHVDFNPEMPEANRRSIYVPSSQEYIGDGPSLHEGEWVRFEADLLPLVERGLANAKAKGAFADSPDTLDAYRIVHINIGWEIPGLAKAKGAIRNLSLVGKLKGRQ
jgi:hypothetical protein